METLRTQMGKAEPKTDAAIFMPKISSGPDRLVSPNFKKDRRGLRFSSEHPLTSSKMGLLVQEQSHKISRLLVMDIPGGKADETTVSALPVQDGLLQIFNRRVGLPRLRCDLQSDDRNSRHSDGSKLSFSHNSALRYLTHALLGKIYMLSEVKSSATMGRQTVKSSIPSAKSLIPSLTHPGFFFTQDCTVVKNGGLL